jgi:hypothetical protein
METTKPRERSGRLARADAGSASIVKLGAHDRAQLVVVAYNRAGQLRLAAYLTTARR